MLLKKLEKANIKINYIIDKDNGGYFKDKLVVSHTVAIKKEKNFLILSENNYKKMKEMLLNINKNVLVATIPSYSQLIKKDPLNYNLHIDLAEVALNKGNYTLANAQLQNYKYLNKNNSAVKIEEKINNKLDKDLYSLSHNTYFRLKSLENEIKKISLGRECSVLDVGGGSGHLKLFLDDSISYFLAEPSINGISGSSLPFKDGEFDYVVSCHVLEHIPVEIRNRFLDDLLAKSRKGIILLNPFNIEKTLPKERLELLIDIGNFEWAKEHYECSLPNLSDLKEYANDRELNINIKQMVIS